MNIEKMITEAITGVTDKETALCRISCNAAASRAMFCGCGVCLDQEKTVVITVRTPKRRAVLAKCLGCWEDESAEILRAAEYTKTPVLIEGWNGVIFKQGNTE